MVPKRMKRGGFHRLVMALMVMAALLVVGVGCDDQSSEEAKLEDARIAIDNGQYQQALDLVGGMTGQDVMSIQSSAYAGKAGVDTFEILAEVDNDGGSSNRGIDLVGKMLGAGDGNTLLCSDITLKMEQIGLAKDVLIDSVGEKSNIEALGNDEKVKLGIFAFTDTALVLGEILCKAYGTMPEIKGKLVLTEEWINTDLKPHTGGGNFSDIDPTQQQLDQITDNIIYVGNAISVLDSRGNDLNKEFEAFVKDIGGGDADGVTVVDLTTYLNGLNN